MHEQFLKRAVEIAEKNVISGKGGPYGALIVKDNTILVSAVNQVTSQLDPTAHAEISAIRQACSKLASFQLSGCTLYTSCEPCPMCLGAIYWSRLDRVYYASSRYDASAAGFDDSFIYEQMLVPSEQRTIAMYQIKIKNSNLPFSIWAKTEAKISY